MTTFIVFSAAPTEPRRQRRAVAVITVLVALAVLSVVFAVVMSQILAQRRLAHQRHRQLAAQWLARAGVELAAARLLRDPAPFSADHVDLAPDAKVRVVAERTGSDSFKVHAEATITPEDGTKVVRSVVAHFRRSASDGVVRLEAIERK